MNKLKTTALIAATLLGLSACAEPRNPQMFTESTVCAWANWSDSPLIHELALNRAALEASGSELPIYRVDSTDELEAFRERLDGVLSFDMGWDEMPSFNEAADEYGTELFAENTLFIVYVPSNTGSLRFEVDEVTIESGSLSITVRQTNFPEIVDCMMAGWYMLVPIRREAAESCSEFHAFTVNTFTDR